jgi:hypothetical protein
MLVRFFSVGISSLTLAVGFALPVWAAKPDVKVISPIGLQRGTSIEVEMSGDQLGDAHQVMFYTPGIEATNIKAVDGNKIKMTVTASADADCDLHAFRVVTHTGLSNMRLMGVSPFPSVAEVEPNNDTGTPQLISMNSTVNGVVATEDTDYYVVEVPQGQMISVEVEGLRLANLNNLFDPFVAILDDHGNELARSDDAALVQQDCVCGAMAPEAGRYFIAVRDSSYGGSRESFYRLHVGSYARPLALLPSGGKPGELLKASCIDALGNIWEESFQLPSVKNDRFRVWSKRGDSTSPSPNFLRVNDCENVIESEPNDDYKSVPVIEKFPVALNGILQAENDQDWYVFSAKKDQTFEFRLFARSMIRSPVDGVIEVHKFDGGRVASNDDAGGGPDSALSFKASADGKYAVCIKDHLNRHGPYHVYRLEIEAPQAQLVTTVKEQERYLSQTIPIHRGSRMAVNVQLERKFVNGNAQIVIPDLPTGVVQTDAVVSENSNSVQLILKAAADAPIGGALVDLSARLKQVDKELVGHMNQRTQLIRGQNNRDVWGVNSDKLAVAVLDEIDFDIEVVAPKVPLVRDGSMGLVVKCKRKEGFTRAVSVRLLDTPSGVSASTAVSIPEGKDEVEIPITANSKASLGVFPLTVLATSKVDKNSTVTVASEFVSLEIADRIFDFQFAKTMAEQGKTSKILIGVNVKRPVDGKMEVEVVGAPPGTALKEAKLPLNKDTKKLTYVLDVPATARPGNFRTIICRGTVTSDKGVIMQVNGNGEVQIDVASNAKPGAVVAKAEADPQLTRLEQLRKQREEQNNNE